LDVIKGEAVVPAIMDSLQRSDAFVNIDKPFDNDGQITYLGSKLSHITQDKPYFNRFDARVSLQRNVAEWLGGESKH
jgi:hypothetical protein